LSKKNFEAIYQDLATFRIGGTFLKPTTNNVLIDLLADYGITNKKVTLWGSGTPYREFLYVNDLAQACLFLMQNCNYEDLTPYVNLGTGQDITIKELALLIQKTVGFHGTIDFDTTKPDGTQKKLLDVSKIHNLGWKNSLNLMQGIVKAYEWYISSQQKSLLPEQKTFYETIN
jgi:Nucleoside-diphosphate-sugar epimerases